MDDVDDDEYDDDGENGKACERDEDSQRMIPQSTANSPLIKRFQSFPTNLEHLGHFGIFCNYERSILGIFCFLNDIFWEQKANDIRWMASAIFIEKNNISIKHL